MANSQLEHFPRLAACVPDDVEPDTCVSVVASPRKEFAPRFARVCPLHGCGLQAVFCPLLHTRRRRPCPPPMELVELQCNDDLKAKFYISSPLSFFRDIALPSRNFPKCIAHVQRIVAMFGSIYCCEHCCEQLFSKMKYLHKVSPSLPALGPPYQ